MTLPCPNRATIGGKTYGCRILGTAHKGQCEFNRPIRPEPEPLTGVI